MPEEKILPLKPTVERARDRAADSPDEARAAQAAAWIEVIRKMDGTYADLVRYQVELEEKNSSLEAAQRFIASVQSSMIDVLIACDANGRIQQVNKAMEVMSGQTEATLRGRLFQSLLEKLRAGVPGALEQALVGTGLRPGETGPLAAQHVFRSLDPCMVCSVH